MVNGFEDRGDGVVVTTADGRTFSGQCLVAADGFRSLFRAKLVGDGEPRPTGYAALRTIVPMTELKVDIPRDSVVLWGGPGYHVIHYPLRHSSQFNIVAVFRTSTHAEKADVETYRNELDHIYRDAHPSVRALNGMSLYLGSKGAIEQFARSLSRELGPRNVTDRKSTRLNSSH